MASVMPVSTAMNGGMAVRGLTRVWNSPTTSPPRTRTAPISVMSQDAAEPPVVSRSTTTNSTSRSGRPSSSKLAWTGTSGRAGDAAWVTGGTLGAPSDGSGERRASRPPYARPVPAALPGPDDRWRCTLCGNLTRFDVTRTTRSTEYVHVDLSGEPVVEERQVLLDAVEQVVCRWCGAADRVELVPRPSASLPAAGGTPPAP
jgi:hypothetical protein